MFQTLSHDGCHMIVCQGVVDGFPFPAEFNQCGLFQNPKLMRDSTLCHGQRICNVLHTTNSCLERTDKIRILVGSPNTLNKSAS